MPLVYQQNINQNTKLGIWHITETATFFLKDVIIINKINHKQKMLQHLAGRYLLKQLFPDFPLDEIAITDTKKPFLPNNLYQFSISHCKNYAAVIISKNNRVGVDIEKATPKIENILHKFLTKSEMIFLPQLSFFKTATLFWSAKETVYKWYGEGSVDFKKDIKIINFDNKNFTSLLNINFKNKYDCNVNFLQFDNFYITWLITSS